MTLRCLQQVVQASGKRGRIAAGQLVGQLGDHRGRPPAPLRVGRLTFAAQLAQYGYLSRFPDDQLLAEHLAQGQVDVRSAGSEPGDSLNPVVVQVLHERGVSTAGETPTLLTRDGVQAADVVVTMGCGETCPVFPAKRYEDWPLEDPKDKDVHTVRGIVDEIDARVCALLRELGVRPSSP